MSSSREQVSVIVPTLDDAHLLGPLVHSVATQSYRPLELIIVDGGSRDDTFERLERMRDLETQDFKITLLHEEDFGDLRSPGNARNIGVEAGHGEYIVFLDSDMRFDDPSGIDMIKKELDSNDFTKVLVRIIEDTEVERYLASFLPSPRTHHCGYRRSVFKIAKFDPILGVGEDRDFWLRASRLGIDMDHTCPVVVTRHLPHTKLEYLKQTEWYFRTLPRFAWAVVSRDEVEYMDEVLDWLRYCSYILTGPLVFLIGLLDRRTRPPAADTLSLRLFDSAVRRYVAAFSLLRGALRSKCLSFITRLTLLSLSTRLKGTRPSANP